MVLHVARCEHAGNARRRGVALVAAMADDVAVLHFQLPFEDGGVGGMADGDEQAHQVEFFRRALGNMLDTDAVDTFGIAQHFVKGVVPFDGDLAGFFFFKQFVLHDFFGAEFVAPVHHGDVARNVGKIKRLFNRSVAAANDRDVLVFVEETVAGGAGRHALAHEFCFRRETEVARRRAGGDDQCVAGVDTGIADEADGLFI